MEIKIVITKGNKEEVLRLIDQLVESEARGIAEESENKALTKPTMAVRSTDVLMKIPGVEEIKVMEPEIEESIFGSWGMFNSYAPGKAALRVLINLLNENMGAPIKFSHLIDECITYFSRSGLYRYRGFPKKTSESARGRLATHLIMPYNDMGLMNVFGQKKDKRVMITKEGLIFAKIPNPLLDERGKTKPLSKEESEWLISHLRRIDPLGYREFSILNDLTQFLAEAERQFEDIVGWFKSNQAFVEWLRDGSRYRDNPKGFSRQLDNVARTFASGKVALLRELGVLSNSRATYRVLHDLEA